MHLLETRTTRLIKGADLNHHGTLFAGRMAEWFTETCFLSAARLLGKPEDLVCVKIHGLTFSKPALPGDIIEIVARAARTGGKSLTIGADVFVNDEERPTIRGFATFATVNHDGATYAHGLALPDDYKARHRDLVDEAERLHAAR